VEILSYCHFPDALRELETKTYSLKWYKKILFQKKRTQGSCGPACLCLCAYMIFVKADPEFLKGKQDGKAKTLARTKGKCFLLDTAR